MKTNLQREALNLFLAWLILMVVSPSISLGQKVKVGGPAPDFSVPALDGDRAIRLSGFRGRRVLIFTWASW